jgi:protein TonB
MNYQSRAFQISFLLHCVIIVLVVIGSTFMGQYKKAMVLDFDLLKPVPDVKKIEEPAPTPFIKAKAINPIARQSLKEKETSRQPEEVSPISPVPETPPVVKLPQAHKLESRSMGLGIPDQAKELKEGSPGIVGKTNSGLDSADGGKGSARAKYLNDHFAYIRDKILRNVSYPDTARRMGWQGKVLLSFIITADGSVRAFKIIQSSGFTILDKSAMETVRDAAPFPRPPGEAELVIPINYRLE